MLEDAAQVLLPGNRQPRICGYTKWISTLEPGDQEIANNLMGNADHAHSSLASYFQSKGADLDQQALSRHRRGVCCGQRTVSTRA